MRLARSAIKGGVALICAAAAVFYFSSQINKVGLQVSEQKNMALMNKDRGEMLTELKTNFETIGHNDQNLENALPPADDIINFIFMLDSLSEKMSLQTTEVFGNPITTDIDSYIDYSVSFGGNIHTLLKYTANFERLPYFTAIKSASINSIANDWEGDSSINIKARLYVK